MATFYNQATLLFGGQRINSNTTAAEIVDAASMSKTAVSASYAAGDAVAYVISIPNDGATALTNLTLTDDLGTYTIAGGMAVTPLEYVPDTLKYYVDGVLLPSPTVTAEDGTLTVTGISVPSGSVAMLIYEARANEFAPLAPGSVITNTATLTGEGLCNTVSDTAAVPVLEAPELSITKTASPEVVTGCGEITYSFIIQNTGNTAAVATDDLIVTDVFDPALSDITVTIDGATVAEGTAYTYDEATGSFTTLPGAITVPAATYAQDPTTGVITVTPGVTVLTVSGTL